MYKEYPANKEALKNPDTSYSFTVMRPGGNDTALVMGVIRSGAMRKEINDVLLGIYKNVEQVGFVNLDPISPELMMAGGEFCGNATRSTAWLVLDGHPGEVNIKVSGVKGKLRAGVTPNGEAFAQMPIYADTSRITKDGDNRIVEMEGITQYINFNTKEIEGLSLDEIKQKAMALIRAKNLDRFPAAGVMYSKKEGSNWRIMPIVYVKEVDTLFAETACGSGTTALGLVLAQQKGESIKDVPIVQPTDLPIKVSVKFDGISFGYAQISGPVEKLVEGTLIQKEEFPYVVEQVTHPKDLESALGKGGLTSLYKDIFAEAPYFESFTDAAVNGFFEDYRRDGILLLASNRDGVIGFGAAVPLKSVPDIAEKMGIPPEYRGNRWYIADLGVKREFRRRDIGKKLTTDTIRGIQALGGKVVDLRTSVNNVIALSLYRQLGFMPIPGVTQEVTGERISGVPKTDTRMFLSKNL
ncbi:MAG: hypothetical protein UV61_C0008G0106 [Candidatus Gottesmanbacteria bacterium GW2011_GWB1_43_11]|uniref:N-acetyltransferase domain-containing protein n=1 Tax=Candidatus Gottesmanbacteria bacterium GW2011_GWB1_43_11 TaxID=1618446 RepID=A0A0G1FIJ4_9BACT|nr:MAG: hypothetical protein UV04_C0009G0062 [Candidatus Gottesmanbacteria bacterium GW2011_GWA2_42_16]KKS54947.1 MAG: hypothetical protein UV17_C0014G0030 [Candidatus Gottesmanbacteria bacterium GW2011_GWA1_42_26]KKS82137.1 MAG: GCN5-related N-acetyltransferase [Candidatus Gottesmanbacteria bacterium GW2011_GWC1_43_10]KKS86653.1 MAG: hypothetical protein UV61_C0008G0106 [Candidatus Gottesmanbacteria bacterium GW2011_GWB1_43_11]OGG10561.1 MAG: hypothetical protein A2699_06375 [Candidatus Gottes